ncbi:MAG: hypothetical protein MJE68_18035, partial [Proteobacteria bacterium]|nr:hypothetical protein [Pseudomonadota bacterium]
MTWLKKQIKLLGLRRRDQHVQYIPMSVVKAAIHVCIIIVASLLVFTMAENRLPVYHTPVGVAGSNCNV